MYIILRFLGDTEKKDIDSIIKALSRLYQS